MMTRAQTQQQQQQQQQAPPPAYSQHQQHAVPRLGPVFGSPKMGNASGPPKRRMDVTLRKPQPPPAGTRPKDEQHTLVAMVVDRSGSMQSFGPEVHGGVNAYLDGCRANDAADGGRTTTMLCTFDNTAELVHDFTDLTAMAPVTAADVHPRGSTALFDAIGATLNKVCEHLHTLDHTPKEIIVFVLTDGQENSSHHWRKKMVTDNIMRLQAEPYKWDFYFAGANQDAMAEGASIGIDTAACMTYSSSPKGITSAFRTQAAAQRRKKCSGSKGYLASERTQCAEK